MKILTFSGFKNNLKFKGNIILSLITLLCTSVIYAQLPAESFEGTTFPPAGWAVYNDLIDAPQSTLTWQQSPSSSGTLSGFTGYGAYLRHENLPPPNNTGAVDWLITKRLTVPPDAILRFYTRLLRENGQGINFDIRISENANQMSLADYVTIIPSSFIPPANPLYPLSESALMEHNSQLLYLQKNVVIPPSYIGKSVYIAFVMKGINSTTEGWLIDDVSILSPCPQPTNMGVTQRTINSATLTWDSTPENSGWEVEIVPQNSAPTGVGNTVTENNITATQNTSGQPFSANEAYKYYVRAQCSTNYRSANNWTGPFEFKTRDYGELCTEPITINSPLPYVDANRQFLGFGSYPANPGTNCGSTGNALNGYYTIYKYSPQSTANVNLTANGGSNTIGLFIYNSCSSIGNSCLAGNLSPDKTVSVTNFTVTAGLDYYIVVSSLSRDKNFILSITENNCSNNISATFNVENGCNKADPYYVKANITNLGNSSSVLVKAYHSSTPSISEDITVTTTGTQTFGPYLSGSVHLVLQGNQNCVLTSPTLSKINCQNNDECSNSFMISLNSGAYCATGSLEGATASSIPNNCPGSADDDVWYSFIANNTTQIITISGTADMNHSVFGNNDCSSLNQLYCSEENYSVATNLVIGQTYYVRVFSADTNLNTSTFEICIISAEPTCLDTNAKSGEVRTLFKNLLNYLKNVTLTQGVGYSCPQLIALKPYLTDTFPRIFKGADNSFAFANDSLHKDFDFKIPYYDSPFFIADILPISYSSAEGYSTLIIVYSNGTVVTNAQSRHINFCPPTNCKPVTGYIKSDPGISCMVPGQAYNFSFSNPSNNIINYQWRVLDGDLNEIASYSGQSQNISVSTNGLYTLQLVITTKDNCKTVIAKTLRVLGNCASYCTETNNKSGAVKELYLNLINYLLATYGNTPGTINTPFNCPELAALAPFITKSNPLIYNLSYDGEHLQFAFDNSSQPDIIVKINGFIYDIDILNYSSPTGLVAYSTSIADGAIHSDHFIKSVDFCPENQCPDIVGNIRLTKGLSCISVGVSSLFQLSTATNNLTDYKWTFYDINGNPLSTVSSETAEMTYTQAGTYLVKFECKIPNTNCAYTFTKSVTVSAIPCTDFCTETNTQTPHIKQLFTDLVNYLLNIYRNGGSLVTYNGPKLKALAPFLTDSNPIVQNITYANGVLKFSFSNHGITPDVTVSSNIRISDINLTNFTSPESTTTCITTLLNAQTSQLVVRHINFCPESCNQIFGSIALRDGQSCVAAGSPRQFLLVSTATNIHSYSWTFFNRSGEIWKTFTNEEPLVTYNELGTYVVKLEVIDNIGCQSTFFKFINVSSNCPQACTETNPDASAVKVILKNLLNKLTAIYDAGLTAGDVDTSMEVSFLSPYIANSPNPGIYNAVKQGNVLSFAFSENASGYDVIFKLNGKIDDINIFDFSSTNANTYPIIYQNGTVESISLRNIEFCPVIPPCDKHIAFVIDESASIDEDEAYNIKKQLKAFIDQQLSQRTTTLISFIGMSDSDNNTRNDHVSSKVTEQSRQVFRQWLTRYRDGYSIQERQRGISPNSDYWASGLKYIMDPQRFPLKPEIVIVITDGSQTKDIQGLKNSIANINNPGSGSHLYVYGIGSGFYVDGTDVQTNPNTQPSNTISEVTDNLMTSLKFLLELPQTQFPPSNEYDLLAGMYYAHDNFDKLRQNVKFFTNELRAKDLGCGGEVNRDTCDECETFQPEPGKTYWLSAWVKEEQNIQVKSYTNAKINLHFEDENLSPLDTIFFKPDEAGEIIDGWQRIGKAFTVPGNARIMNIELANTSLNIPVYFDDIRIHPVNGSMKSYVYDPETFRLMAEHDDNNYSTFYEYDKEGGLVRVKKETSKGIKTIQETRSGSVIKSVEND